MRRIRRIVALSVAVGVLSPVLSQAAPPFANAQPAPTSSPYFALFNNRFRASPYQTLVRPRIEIHKQFDERQRQLDQLERQQQAAQKLQALYSPPPRFGPPPSSRGASRYIRSTGHETRFQDSRRFQNPLQYFQQQYR